MKAAKLFDTIPLRKFCDKGTIPDVLKYKLHSRTTVFLSRKLLINTIYNNKYTRNPHLGKNENLYIFYIFWNLVH